MRTRTRDFPGTDHETSERLALEVARDEEAIINAILELRQTNPMSLEAIGFLLGADPSHFAISERQFERYADELPSNSASPRLSLPDCSRSGRYRGIGKCGAGRS